MIGVFNVLLCCIAMIIQGQQAAPRTHVRLAVAASQDALISEQLKHTQRVARLMVIQQLALQDEYTEISSVADKLLEEEYKRHSEFVDQWTQSRMESDTNEVNDAWWKDVGKKQRDRDSNSTSVLLKNGWGDAAIKIKP